MVMGRPKKPDSERREKPLRIRVTKDERRILDEAAQNAGQETSTWARDILLKNARNTPVKTKKNKVR